MTTNGKLEPYSFTVLWKNQRTAEITISADRKFVDYKKYTDEIPLAPFAFDDPTVEQVFDFIKSRCMDERRVQLEEYLNDLGLNEYNPYEIVKITHGVMFEDYMWFRFPEEALSWEDVRARE